MPSPESANHSGVGRTNPSYRSARFDSDSGIPMTDLSPVHRSMTSPSLVARLNHPMFGASTRRIGDVGRDHPFRRRTDEGCRLSDETEPGGRLTGEATGPEPEAGEVPQQPDIVAFDLLAVREAVEAADGATLQRQSR